MKIYGFTLSNTHVSPAVFWLRAICVRLGLLIWFAVFTRYAVLAIAHFTRLHGAIVLAVDVVLLARLSVNGCDRALLPASLQTVVQYAAAAVSVYYLSTVLVWPAWEVGALMLPIVVELAYRAYKWVDADIKRSLDKAEDGQILGG